MQTNVRNIFDFLITLQMQLFYLLTLRFQPSTECGPFSTYSRPYDVITEAVGRLPEWLDDALSYLVTPAVLLPLVMLLV